MNTRRKLLVALGAGTFTASLVLKRLGGFARNEDRAVCAFTLLVVVWAALTMTTAAAAEYPARPIRFIVPVAAGSGPDINARLLAPELGKQMGQQVVVDNRPGASSVIGTEMIVRAAPDGYTIGYAAGTVLALNRSLMAKLPYDPDKDLQMVVQLGFQPNLLAVTPSLPVKSVQELIDYAKNNPGKLSYGSPGNGTSQHLTAELFKLMTATQIVHVPYKGVQQAITDMIGGQVQLAFPNVSPILPHIKAGRVRGLGVTSLTRSPAIPELPTIAEAGVPGFEVVAWAGVVVPSGVPKTIIAKLNAEINKAIALPTLKEKFAANGYVLVGGTPEQFAEHVRKEVVKWAKIIKDANIKPD
jgi:tripartite-type tricarboxylate transporter receptor subunit TctC